MLMVGIVLAQQATVREIVVRGNNNISRDFILAAMRTKEGGAFLQAELPNDEAAVRELGYFKDVKVLSRSLSDTDWQVIVEVEENPLVKEIRVVGNTVVPTAEILKLVTQETGRVFNNRTARPTSDAISDLYQKKGYFAEADIGPQPESPETLQIRVVERAVRDIVVQGAVRTKESVIRRLLKTKPGEAFSQYKWDADRRRLDSTQWFETVTARSRPTDEIGKFDLLLEVKEARTAQIGAGLALDPRSRLAGSLRYTDTNFRGNGQTVGAALTQSTTGGGTSITLDYVNPWMDSRETNMSVRLYSRVVTYFSGSGIGSVDSPTDDRFDERRTGGSVAFSRPFRNIYIGTIGASFEKIETVNLKSEGKANFIQQDGDLTMLNLQVARDTRDVPLDPAEGDFTRLAVEPGISNITKIGGNVGDVTDVLGTNTFVRTTLEYKSFFSKRPKREEDFADPRKVLAFRARYGFISGKVPFFEQLFVGGSDTLRGYSDQRFWGRQSFLTSLEYRIPIQKYLNVIPFVDYGGAWGGYGTVNNFDQSRTPRFHVGYGAGVAFRLPIGMVRVDFGFNEQGGSRTHFSIGGSF